MGAPAFPAPSLGETAPHNWGACCRGTVAARRHSVSRDGSRQFRSPERLPRRRRQARKPLATKKRQRSDILSIKGKAYIAGIYEHPTRHAPDKSTAQLHAEVAKGAIEDAGLTKTDIDGYFCAGDAPGGLWPMVDYLGLKVPPMDSTETGGCSYPIHLCHATQPLAAGKCSIPLLTLPRKPLPVAM